MGVMVGLKRTLLAIAGACLGLILLFLAISFLFNATLIYDHLYFVLAIAAILTAAPGVILMTWNSKRIIRVAAVLVVTALLILSGGFFFFLNLLSGNLLKHQYDHIVYSVEDGRRIVELSQSWTWIMEDFGGVEYKKAYVVFGIFYDNDLIAHTGAPTP